MCLFSFAEGGSVVSLSQYVLAAQVALLFYELCLSIVLYENESRNKAVNVESRCPLELVIDPL